MQNTNLNIVKLKRHFFYLAISAFALFFDQMVSNILFYKMDLSPVFSTSAGYLLGLAAHYRLAMYFVFVENKAENSFSTYVVSGLLGLAIHYSLAFMLVQILGLQFFMAKGISAALSFFVVYWVRLMWYGLKNE